MYDIIKSPTSSGYYVSDKKKLFSNRPLSKQTAQKQRIAIALSEHKKTGKPMKLLFGK
jgi:hypothetical protein